ncbi:MAG: hypothetical protein LBC82_03920 [Oscillospiraceae bacterium]|nr:hypothetical protein [Oscillospiraceae bacterium]
MRKNQNKVKSCGVKAIIMAAVITVSLIAGVFTVIAAEERSLPDWVFSGEHPVPSWLYGVDELPDWFYELPSEPVWYRQIDRIPAWFYTITEIPDWFYPPEENETPEAEPSDEPDDIEFPDPEIPDEPERNFYSYSVLGGQTLVASVPKGMITNDDVFLDFPSPLLIIMRGDTFVPFSPVEPITGNGEYRVVMVENPEVEVFNFTIANGAVNFLNAFTAPEGFTIVEVLFDGQSQQISNEKRFATDTDGDYRFTITDSSFETVYTVNITLRTTPPALIFSRIAKDNEIVELEWSEEGNDAFEGPIVFSSDEINEYTISVLYNRTPINTPNNHTLIEAGRYHITAVDTAGNSTQYTFRILYVMDVPTGWVIAIVAILLTALIIYLARNRKKVRIR